MFESMIGREPSAASQEWATRAGVVFDVQRHSLHDGPGLRTNVFLKGCPLRCGWCANPESQALAPEPMLRAKLCLDCGLFAEPCHDGTARVSTRDIDARVSTRDIDARVSTRDIDARVALCPTGALTWVGARRTAGEVMAEVLRDRPFYGQGGGMTLTGGEPTMQPGFCEALLRLAKQTGVSTAIETCGHAPWPAFARLLPFLDTVLFDIKHIDRDRHRQFTGMDNTLILANLRRIVAAGAMVRVRVPLIPGFNAEPEAIAAIATLVMTLPGPVQGVDLLPYHSLGRAKYAALGREYPWRGHKRLSQPEIDSLAAIVAHHGLPVTVGG